MPPKPRVAVLASRFPYPIEKGDKLRLYYQLKYLAEDFEIYLFALNETEVLPEHMAEISQYCQRIFLYQESVRQRQYRVIQNFLKPWPSQVHYFYSPQIHQTFLKDFFTVNADVIYCQLYRMAPYLAGITAPKVLDVMDSFATIAELHGNNARYFYERWFWKKEHRHIERYESEQMDQFHHYTVISERDAALLTLPDQSAVSIVRNGIDVDYFQEYDAKHQPPTYDLAFVGNMEYKPNIEAVRYIRHQLIPRFEQEGMPVRILIGGKGAAGLEKAITPHSGMEYHDWYEDIRTAYYDAKIFIAPLFLGSGMQNKVLEAMAAGRPVICSSHVIAAMPMLRDLVYIADEPGEYLDQYRSLQINPYTEEKQIEVLTVLKNELTWKSQGEILKKVIHDTGKNYKWDFARYH